MPSSQKNKVSQLKAAKAFPKPSIGNEKIKTYIGDSYKVLKRFPSNSIDTCLTSPPYWGVRDYNANDQIGLEGDLNTYIKNIVKVFSEVKRVLRPEGTAWLNLGDKYLHGAPTKNGLPPQKGWERNKQLSLVPFRVALALQDDGWWIRNTVVWQKPNAMPSSVRDRLTSTWEPVFLLTKSEQYYFNLDEIRVEHKTDDAVEKARALNGVTNGKAKGNKALRQWLNSPRHRATIDGLKEIRRRPHAPEAVELAEYLREYLEKRTVSIRWVAEQLEEPFERVRHYFRTDKIGSRLPPEKTWFKLKRLLRLDSTYDEAMSVEVGDNIFRNHPKGRNPGDVQSFALTGSSEKHFATMPLSLARWVLKATLPNGGICLDPFMGYGTTGIATLEFGGQFVGIDVVEDYIKEFWDSFDG